MNKPTGQLAVVAKNVVNLYAEPSTSSEQISQAIMGQHAWIEAGQDEWVYIRTWDDYHGWAQSRWILPRMFEPAYASGHAVAVVKKLLCDVLAAPDASADILTKIPVTTDLEIAKAGNEWVEVTLPDGRQGHIPHRDVKLVDRVASHIIMPPSKDKLVETAKRFIGTPYLWGGTTPFGIDCSGFVQLVYRIHDITLKRDAYMQADDERAAPLGNEPLQASDLVFFSGGSDKEKITHVGMAIGDGQFIHSSSGTGVIVSGLDEPRYQDIYWGARRIRCSNWEAGCPVEGHG